jgi:hypothetical protein
MNSLPPDRIAPSASGDVRSSTACADGARSQLDSHGVSVVHNCLPRPILRKLEQQITEVMRHHMWSDPIATAAHPRREGSHGWWRMYEDVQRLELFHAVCRSREVRGLASRCVPGKVLHHLKHQLTVVAPGFLVQPYQDFPNIQGSPNFVALWIPLSDPTEDLSRLQVLSGPPPISVAPVVAYPASSYGVAPSVCEGEWMTPRLELGDCLMLHPLAIRRWAENRSRSSWDLGVLVRFQPLAEPICPASLMPHHYPRIPGWKSLGRHWPRASRIRPPRLVRRVPFVLPDDLATWHIALNRSLHGPGI